MIIQSNHLCKMKCKIKVEILNPQKLLMILVRIMSNKININKQKKANSIKREKNKI